MLGHIEIIKKKEKLNSIQSHKEPRQMQKIDYKQKRFREEDSNSDSNNEDFDLDEMKTQTAI